jgi:hypothetical protein
MRRIILAALCLPLAACATTKCEPKIVTQTVEVAIPVPCDPIFSEPPHRYTDAEFKTVMAAKDFGTAFAGVSGQFVGLKASILTFDQFRTAYAKAPNTGERARLVASQLSLWQGWGPQIEAGLDGCKAGTAEPSKPTTP